MITSEARCLILAVVTVLATSVVDVPSALADTESEQRAVVLFDKGRKLARDGHCADAIAPLLESIRYAEGVGPLLNLGNCYESLGKTASAHRYFVRAHEVASSHSDARRDEAAQRARSIEKDVPLLVVHVPVALKSSAEVRIDGETWPRERWEAPAPIDPGTHEIELTAPPHPRHTATITITKGARTEWMAPSLPEPSPRAERGPSASRPLEPNAADAAQTDSSAVQRPIGIAVGAAGIGGLVAGAILGVISISAHSTVVGRCPTYPRCASSDRALIDETNSKAETTGTISTVAVIAGIALLAGGALLYFTAPPRTEPKVSRAY